MSNELKFLSIGRETDRHADDYDKCFLTVATPSGRIRRVYLDESDLLRVVLQSVQLLEYLERDRRNKVKP